MGKTKEISTKKMVTMAVLVALSFAGSFIKIPATSIALDSMPGFFAAVAIDPVSGAIVAALGHLITAMVSGFPNELPIHLWLMLGMAITVYLYGRVYKKRGAIPGIIVGTLLNGPGTLVVSSLIKSAMGIMPFKAFFLMLVGILTAASLANIIIATLLYEILKNRIEDFN